MIWVSFQKAIVTGVVTAEQLLAEIETDSKISSKMMSALKKNACNKIDFSNLKNNIVKMVAGTERFPIAVKASRIDFDKGRYKGLTLVTDGRDLF